MPTDTVAVAAGFPVSAPVVAEGDVTRPRRWPRSHDERDHNHDADAGQDGRKRRSRFSMLTDLLGRGED